MKNYHNDPETMLHAADMAMYRVKARRAGASGT